MAEIILFTGAELKSFSRTSEGATAVFQSNLTPDIIEDMEWGQLQSWETKAALDGELHAKTMKLRPTEGALAKYEILIDVSIVNGFVAVRREVKGSKNKGHRHELHFKVEFADPKGCQYLEEYLTHAGKGGTLEVSYVKQQKLPLAAAAPASKQQTLTRQ